MLAPHLPSSHFGALPGAALLLGGSWDTQPPPPARCEAKLCEGKEKFCCSGCWGASLHSTLAGNPRTPRGFGDFCSEKPMSISHFCTALAFAGEY